MIALLTICRSENSSVSWNCFLSKLSVLPGVVNGRRYQAKKRLYTKITSSPPPFAVQGDHLYRSCTYKFMIQFLFKNILYSLYFIMNFSYLGEETQSTEFKEKLIRVQIVSHFGNKNVIQQSSFLALQALCLNTWFCS